MTKRVIMVTGNHQVVTNGQPVSGAAAAAVMAQVRASLARAGITPGQPPVAQDAASDLNIVTASGVEVHVQGRGNVVHVGPVLRINRMVAGRNINITTGDQTIVNEG
ncbi:hypothetical protein HGA91_03965 [candidate division WWE3 bacterium]|nr:hypothetical protein [candidate division WWE3 bacterium]